MMIHVPHTPKKSSYDPTQPQTEEEKRNARENTGISSALFIAILSALFVVGLAVYFLFA